MSTTETETRVAGPIQKIGMAYYFDPGTAAVASDFGINVFEFYGLGRGGVLGNVSTDEVIEAFWFFHERAITNLFATDKADPTTVASGHLDAAYAFADRTFGSLDPTMLAQFAAAAHKVIDAVPVGKYALVDGYRKFPVPSNPLHAAYLATIMLRELRGAVHIDTTREVGLSASEACFISNEMIFKLHGYSDADAPERTPDLEAKLVEAEERTTTTMAGYLGVLSEDELAAYGAGVAALAHRLDEAQGAA
jgi:hypothetical protein